ncbi:MAG: hypothetical protein GF341_06975 [candidate division Zixibacteria bacterium]|nr:hypothetical protein [candidate division Zixibacteria bacterium]
MWNERRLLLVTVGILALLLLLGVNLGYRVAFGELQRSLDEQLGDQLAGMAEALADGIAPDVRRGIVGDDFDVSSYLRVHDLLETFAEGNRLVSVNLLDTLWQDPFADGTDSLTRMVNSLLDEAGQWAVMSGLTWVSPTFQWGDTYYRSAAAPITAVDGDHTIAIVRLEVDAGYFSTIRTLDNLAWWIHGSSAVFALLLVILFAWYAKRSREWETRLLHNEKLIGLGRLAATIAHEIKNPLGIIKATAQRLDKVDDPDKRAELISFIPEETDRLNRILAGYLRIASPDEHQPQPVAIDRQLREWMENAYRKDEQNRDRWSLTVTPTPPILANPDAPRQVLLNLVNNAFDVTPPDGSVRVEWGAVDHARGRLVIEDAGPGIPRKLRKHVFEPFYTTKAKGSGLGLYAVQVMVERDGGTVRIDDTAAGGARFIVEWPFAQATQTDSGA